MLDVLNAFASAELDYFVLLLIRMAALVMSSPTLGRTNIPQMAKIGLAGALALWLYPSISVSPPLEYGGLGGFAALCLLEVLFGVILGYVQTLFFSVSQMAGQMMDMQMGFGMANVLDVQLGTSVPMTGSFFNIIFMLLFFAGNWHLKLVQVLVLTVEKIPIGHVRFSPDLGFVAAELFALVFSLSVTLSLPVLFSGLMLEGAMGVLMRTAPQMNMFVVGVPIKILLGFVMLLICIPLILEFGTELFDTMIAGIEHMYAAMMVAGV